MLQTILYLLRTKRTPKQIAKLYSKLVCLDLDSPVQTESCVVDTHGLTLELQREGHCYYVTESSEGRGLKVTEARLKNDLVYYKQVATESECCDYSWVKLLVDGKVGWVNWTLLTKRNYYLQRQKELLASMVNGL